MKQIEKYYLNIVRYNRVLDIIFSMILISVYLCTYLYAYELNSDTTSGIFRCELFLPELFSKNSFRQHGYPTFVDDLCEVIWPVIPPQILVARQTGGLWSEPEPIDFSEGNIQAVHYSNVQQRMYFQLSHIKGFGSLDIWYVDKSDSGWSEKKNPGNPPNSMKLESQPSLSQTNNLYFTGYDEGSGLQRGIYKSAFKDDRYQLPERLPAPINTQFIYYMPFISPDECFLLFASSRPSMDENSIRIYISFKIGEDSWSEPVNLNKLIEFDQPSRFPCLTPDAQFIVFLSNNQYWQVTAKIIDIARQMVNQ